jgi:hypothetical protein
MAIDKEPSPAIARSQEISNNLQPTFGNIRLTIKIEGNGKMRG